MVEVQMTKEETEALSWMDLDDEALGKLCRATMAKFAVKEDDEADSGKVIGFSAALHLAGIMAAINADETKITLEGFTYKKEPIGDVEVRIHVIDKLPRPTSRELLGQISSGIEEAIDDVIHDNRAWVRHIANLKVDGVPVVIVVGRMDDDLSDIT